MSLRGTVKSNVRLAFKLIQDLGVDVILTKVSATSFNFGTNTTETTVEKTEVIRGVLIKTTKNKKDNTSLLGELLLKSEDLDDPSVYDSLEINGQTWYVYEYTDDGYVITAKISKER